MLYSRSRIRVCLCWLWSCGTLLLQWIRVPELLYSRLEKGRKLERKRERKLKIGQTSKSQAFLFLRWVSRLYPIASLSFFILLCLACTPPPPTLPLFQPKKSAKGGESYYAWHGCRGLPLIWTQPSWSISSLALLQHCVFVSESACSSPYVTAKLLNYANQQSVPKVKHTGLIPCGIDLTL